LLRAIPLSDKAVLSTSILIDWDGVKFLLDAGPGITNEICSRNLGLSKIRLVIISHSHIDHFWDLVPLLWMRRMLGHKGTVQIVCPENEVQLFEWCVKVSQAGDLANVTGMKPGEKLEIAGLCVEAFEVSHAKNQLCLGYMIYEPTKRRLRTDKLEKKGVPTELWRELAEGQKVHFKGEHLNPEDYLIIKQRKVVYSGDARPCKELDQAARNASLLIVEATFLDETYVDMAHEYGHMIVSEAVNTAIRAKAMNLLLTHRSLRHTADEVRLEANKTIKHSSEHIELFVGLDPVTIK
jgi:ribonuclease Z